MVAECCCIDAAPRRGDFSGDLGDLSFSRTCGLTRLTDGSSGDVSFIDRDDDQRACARVLGGRGFTLAMEFERCAALVGDMERSDVTLSEDGCTGKPSCSVVFVGEDGQKCTTSPYSRVERLECNEELRGAVLCSEAVLFRPSPPLIAVAGLPFTSFFSSLDLTTEGFDKHARNSSFDESFGMVLGERISLG